MERLDEILRRRGEAGADACIAAIRDEVARFSEGAPPADDQTLIALRA